MMRFDQEEIKELIIAWFSVSLAFGILLGGIGAGFLRAFFLSAITAGSGFLLHELGHKYFAQKYGCSAKFRSFKMMLIVMVALSFFGFIFAAPGAVFITGFVDRRKNGIISLAGPIVNVILAIVFFLIGSLGGIFTSLGTYGYRINSLLGFFNMLPFFGLDGVKVLSWNKVVYGIVLAIAGLMAFF